MDDPYKALHEAVDKLVENNSVKYALTKLSEELMELGQVCMKMANKKKEKWPPIQDLADELGDVKIRSTVLIRKLDLSDMVDKRLISKSKKLLGYLETYSEV